MEDIEVGSPEHLSLLPERKRGKILYGHDYTSKHLYKVYKKIAKYPVNYKMFRILLDELFGKMVHAMAYEAATIVLPFRMGNLRVMKVKVNYFDKNGNFQKNKAPIDFNATYEYWKTNPQAAKKRTLIYHRNTHTRGMILQVEWRKFWNSPQIIFVYKLRLQRKNTRLIAKAAKSGDRSVDFYEKR